MSQKNRATVSMSFGDGSNISSWLSFNMRDSWMDPLGSLQFEAAPPRSQIAQYDAKLAKGELVTLKANDVNQGTFLITTVEKTIAPDAGKTYSITCKSVLATAREGCAKPELNWSKQTDTPLEDVILDAMRAYGFVKIDADPIADVSVKTGKPVSKRGGGGKINKGLLQTQEAKVQEGERAYQFCTRILTRLGVTMRMTVDGTLLLVAPNYDQEVAYTVVQDFDRTTEGDRFFGPISIRSTNDDQFADVRVRGLAYDKRGRKQSATPEAIVAATDVLPTRSQYSSFAAAYKRLEILDKDSRDVKACTSVAKLALGVRAANAFMVSGMVDGFISSTGRVWQVDTLARVVIAAEAMDEEMYLLERSMIQDREGGQRTQLTFIPKGALIIGDAPA